MTPIAEGLWLVKDIGWIQLPVCGQGNVKIIARVDGQEHTGQLKNVLFVPSLNANLISIGVHYQCSLKTKQSLTVKTK